MYYYMAPYGPLASSAGYTENNEYLYVGEDVIREALELTEIDFAEICVARIRSMGGIGIFHHTEEKNKAISALMRYGFSYQDIREATALLRDEEE
jgi:SOS response regulatory protein OraA/RecX